MAQLLNNARTAFTDLWADAVWEEWIAVPPAPASSVMSGPSERRPVQSPAP